MGWNVVATATLQHISSHWHRGAAASSTSIQELPCPSFRCRSPWHAMVRSQRNRSSITCATMVAGSHHQQQHPFDEGKGRRCSSDNPAGYTPSVWDDFFLHYDNPTATLQQRSMEERANILKKEVAKMISSSSTCNLLEMLHLVYVLERLCLDYLFEEEINGALQKISKVDVEDCDLHTVSLWFYLLRSHRHKASPDVFAKFKDEEGRFSWQNPRDLLSLYNAAHLRMHGETILDEALSFTKTSLESMLPYLEQEGSLGHEITRALAIPVPRRVRIYDCKYYISMYQRDTTLDRRVLTLAKLNSNLMQLHHQQELKVLTRWWKELRLEANLSFTRDRIVENYFGMTAAYFEPSYSRGRIILTMVFSTILILDDIYDVYGTSQECEQFTKCIECWDRKAAQDLPDNMKLVLEKVLDTFETMEDGLELLEKYRMSYLRDVTIDMIRAYIVELKWRDRRYIPGTVEEHLQISGRTAGIYLLCCASFVGMGDIATEEVFEWVSHMPKMIQSVCKLTRLSDDLAESYYEQEQTTGLELASAVDSCMKEHSITRESAHEKVKELKEDLWKDVNEEWLKPGNNAQPKELLERIINLTRAVEFLYNQRDVLIYNRDIKETIYSLFVEPFSNI
ncbi:unnamed protein product [Urochloa decumbens]|uniref:Uncharacterized protein n=1 Tax=Urochloa decumbens TaxID=240449 RepID=A0ABC9CDA2_9POAL